MKLKGQLTDEEYNPKREELSADKTKTKENIDSYDSRIDDWLELTEKAFDFVSCAKDVFESGDYETKRGILAAIGKNITLLDGKIHIEPEEWLVPNMSLSFILERSIFYTDNIGCNSIGIIAESRGKKEDNHLFTQYQLILSNGTTYITNERFKNKIKSFKFINKSENNIGTQIADLVAYPIATKIIYPDRINLAFEVFEDKIYRQFPNSDYLGYGLRVFP